MKYVSFIIKSSIRILLIFMVAYVWINNYVKNSYITITISALLSIAIESIILLYNRRKNQKNTLTKEESKMKDIWQTALTLQNKKETLLNIEKMINEDTTITKNTYVIITNQDKIVYPIFYRDKVNIEDINTLYNILIIENINNAEILCNDIDESASILTSKISDKTITILNINDVYSKYIKPNHISPPTTINIKNEKHKNKNYYTDIIFNKKLLKNYILGGILLFFTSFFTKFSIVYEIMGTVMIVFAFICMLRKSNNLVSK